MADIGNGKQGFGRDLFVTRFHGLRMSQAKFAERFGLTFSMVKNAEQERYTPNPALRVLLAAIEMDPVFMKRAAKAARERWG